ncbi:MAG: ISNCY family transposase [Acidobacteriota bacterium]|nr:ISNCY family transposase [Acidobacteriota bacterium]
MTQKQLQRLKVIENAVEGKLTVVEASVLLGISPRQVKRYKARFDARVHDWVLHGNDGREAHNRFPDGVVEQIATLATGKYKGFNDSHLWEKLTKVEKLTVSRETVRSLLRSRGIRSPQKRRPRKYRTRRERKAQFGMMALADASRHDWLEQRGPVLTLMGFMDDATSQVLAVCFQTGPEDTAGYFATLRTMVEIHGVPCSLYRDQHGTFQRNDPYWTVQEQLAGRQAPTHLGRVMEELGITQIAALSPQAKGRIERLWRTFQDRLTSELRLAGASNLDQANTILAQFVRDHNTRFSLPAREREIAFRRLDRGVDLNRLFSLRYTRIVANDHTVPFGSRTIQLPAIAGGRGYAGKTVDLCHQPNGDLLVYLGDVLLHQTQVLDSGEAVRTRNIQRSAKKKKQPRIYSFAGRAAIAVRP